jgi:hypothetical protein
LTLIVSKASLGTVNASLISTYGVMCADIWSVLATVASPTTDGVQKAGYDGLHWSALGAYHVANEAYYPALKNILKGKRAYPDPRLSNFVTNGIFTAASGGTAGTGASGSIPAAFSLANLTASGTVTAVGSASTNPDTEGNVYFVDFAQHAGGHAVEMIIRLYSTSTFDLTHIRWEMGSVRSQGRTFRMERRVVCRLVQRRRRYNSIYVRERGRLATQRHVCPTSSVRLG